MAKNNIADLNFTPSNGWLDKTAYPTYYTDEMHVRKTLQKPLEQIKEYINNTLNEALSSETVNSEGASLIGMSALFEGDTSGASVADKLKKLRQDYEELINLSIPDNTLTASKLKAGAVTEEKLASGSVTTEKLSSELSGSISSAYSSAELSRYDFMGVIIGLEQYNTSIDTSGIPTRRICYDSFIGTSKTDLQNSIATIDTKEKKMFTKQNENISPYQTHSTNYTLNISSNSILCAIITAPPKMILNGASFSCSISGMSPYATVKLIVKKADSSNIPTDEILAQSLPVSCIEEGKKTLTLTTPLTLTEGEKYALMLEFTVNNEYTTISLTSATLSGKMMVQGLLGKTADGVTTWKTSRLPISLLINRGWTQPGTYVSHEQNLTDNVTTASLYIRKTSGITAAPSIAMYSSGDTPVFAEMTKDDSHVSFNFPNGETEEKWDYTSSASANLAKVKIVFSNDGTENQYIKSYGVIFK